jgi:hypothetical protein
MKLVLLVAGCFSKILSAGCLHGNVCRLLSMKLDGSVVYLTRVVLDRVPSAGCESLCADLLICLGVMRWLLLLLLLLLQALPARDCSGAFH